MNTKDPQSIDDIFNQLNLKANKLYKFVMLYHDLITATHDYGTGHLINMVEVHTLTEIEENPGTTITELSQVWNRTKGAVSQTVSKLVKKGYVVRRKSKTNQKNILLYPTEEGTALSVAHKNYDTVDITKTLNVILKHCTMDEIDTFYKVIQCYTDILEE